MQALKFKGLFSPPRIINVRNQASLLSNFYERRFVKSYTGIKFLAK